MTTTNHGKELVERLAKIKLSVRILAVALMAELDDLDRPTLIAKLNEIAAECDEAHSHYGGEHG